MTSWRRASRSSRTRCGPEPRYGFLVAAAACGGRGLPWCAARAAAARAAAARAVAASAFAACCASCGVIQAEHRPEGRAPDAALVAATLHHHERHVRHPGLQQLPEVLRGEDVRL